MSCKGAKEKKTKKKKKGAPHTSLRHVTSQSTQAEFVTRIAKRFKNEDVCAWVKRPFSIF